MGLIITKNNNHIVKYLIEGYIDEVNEISTLRTDFAPGSRVIALDTGIEYILTSNKTWQPVKKF